MDGHDRIEASADTRAATGITHYVFQTNGGWKAFEVNGTEIAEYKPSSEALQNSLLRVGWPGQEIEILYSIRKPDGLTIDGTLNGSRFAVTFAQDGTLLGDPPKLNIDPTFHKLFRGIGRDLKANKGTGNTGARPLMSSAACGGLYDAIQGAMRAHEWLSIMLLVNEYGTLCAR
jgi:hypothetical protein